MLEIHKANPGGPAKGAIYASTVKDAGGDGTRLTFFNELEGHGLGKLIVGFALRSARKGADDFGTSIKRAVEAA